MRRMRNRYARVFVRLGMILSLVVALIGAGGLGWFIWQTRPIAAEVVVQSATPTPSVTPSSPTPTTATPSPTPTQSPSAEPLCNGVVGTPVSVTIAGLGLVDTKIVTLTVDVSKTGGLGDPTDKTKLGWQSLFPGVSPGACKGAVLITGHTYHDNSAVFKETYGGVKFSQLTKLGMVVALTTDKGVYYYRIDWQATVSNADYPKFVTGNDLYDIHHVQEEKLMFFTCSDWNGVTHPTETMFSGHRIPPPS